VIRGKQHYNISIWAIWTTEPLEFKGVKVCHLQLRRVRSTKVCRLWNSCRYWYECVCKSRRTLWGH